MALITHPQLPITKPSPLQRIQSVVLLELGVDFGEFLMELPWFFEEGFGGNGEEFRWVFCAVGVDDLGFPLLGDVGEAFEGWLEGGGPGAVGAAGFEVGDAIASAVGLV